MNISHAFSAFVPTLEAAALEALVRTSEPLALVRVFEMTSGGSLNGIRKALGRLVDSGVVHESGSPPRYVLNRDHLAFPAIEALAGLRARFFQRLRDLVADWESPPDLAGVFGSFARHEGDSDSDIDVLIVGAPSDEEVAGLASSIERWTGNRAQVVVLGRDEYRRVVESGEPVSAEWDRDLHVVAGDPSLVTIGKTGR